MAYLQSSVLKGDLATVCGRRDVGHHRFDLARHMLQQGSV